MTSSLSTPFQTDPSLSYLGDNAGDTTQLAGSLSDGVFKTDLDFDMDSSSWMGDAFSSFNNSLSSVGKITGGIASLAQIGLGFKALGLAEDELDIKKDQWATSKKEIAHLNKTRKRITNSYMGASQSPTSALA